MTSFSIIFGGLSHADYADLADSAQTKNSLQGLRPAESTVPVNVIVIVY